MATSVAPTVFATTPFLTIEQVAAELRTDQIHIRRLIARGALKGIRAGGDVRDWKITSDELSRYVASGSPDFESIDLSTTEDWFGLYGLAGGSADQYAGCDHQTLYAHNDAFKRDLRATVYAALPETLAPELAGEKNPVLDFAATPEVRALANALPYQPFVRMAGAPAPRNRFGNRAGEWAAIEIRNSIKWRLSNSQRRIDLAETTLGRLYASPESYRTIVAEAVKAIEAGSMTVAKTYPGLPGGNAVTVRYRVRHNALGVNFTRVAETAL